MKKIKNKNIKIFLTVAALLTGGMFLFFGFVSAQTARQLDVAAYITDKNNEELSNGKYDVRFAIYSGDALVWQETQNIEIRNGMLSAYLGAVTPLPDSLKFDSDEYSLGIKIGNDNEMTPRKKIGSVPMAINSQYLQGAAIGTKKGDIPQLGNGGKMNIKQLPTGTGSNKLVLGNDDRLHSQNTDTGTDSLLFNLGSDSALSGNNFDITVSNESVKPTLRFNGAESKWQFSNDGSTFSDFGSGGSGNYLTLSGGTMTGDIVFSSTQTFDASDISSGTLAAARGGTGIDTSASTGVPTISTGTWSVASSLATPLGGTGLSSYTAGDMFYYSSGTAFSKLTVGLNGQVLVISGGVPTWTSTAPSTPHNLLSVQHSDSTSGTVARGDLITGQGASTTWSRLAVGLSGYILRSDGTDVSWSPTTNITTLGTITSGTWNGNTIGISYGGTNATTIGSAGSVPYSTGTAYAFSAAGTTGQALISGGAGTPTWYAPTAGSVLFAGTSGILQQDNASLFFDDTNNYLGVGTASPITQLHIPGKVPSAATGSLSTGAFTTPRSVYVQGRYAYIVRNGDATLQIIDVSNPDSPVSKGSVATGASPDGVYVQGRYAYVANSGSNTLQIFDVSNPAAPTSVGSVATGAGPWRVYVQGRYAYVLNVTAATFQIFDVSNPSAPASVGSVSTGTTPYSIYVQGRYAYVVNFSTSVLSIFDVSNPASPVSVGSVATGGSSRWVHVQGRYAYVINDFDNTLQIFDVSNPASPSSVSSLVTNFSEPHNIYVQGRYAYVTGYSMSGLQVINVSNPASPANVGIVYTGSDPYGVYMQGRYAYVVAGSANTLEVYDMGGSYIQQLEAGGIETGTLATRNNLQVGNDLDVRGGGVFGRGIEATGNSSVYGNLALSGAITSGTWNGTAIGTQYGGTGINTSASTGVPTIATGTWSVASSLGIALGGTNATTIGSAGSVPYSTGTAYAFSAAGTTGQALISGGAGTPTWYAPTAGSVLFAGTSGILQQDNASLFWDDTNNRLGIGTASPTSHLEVYSGTADSIFTLTSATASTEPMLKFRTGVTPAVQFSMGVDTADSNKFKIFSGDGISGTSEFSIDTTGLVSIANMELGAQAFADNAGAVSLVDMAVTSSAISGTVESYTAYLDGNAMLTAYGESDGAGGTQNRGVGIATASPTAWLHLPAGTTTQPPLKLTAGTNLTSAEAGAIEFDGTDLYYSTSVPTRRTVANLDASQTLTNKTMSTGSAWNGTAVGAQYGGTGINTSASTGVPTIAAGTWSVASSLGIALGGTNATTIGSAGSVPYSTGTAYAFSGVGTTGQALISGGAGVPTWYAPTAGSVLFAGTSGILQQDNASLFWDDTNNYLGVGTATPSGRLHSYVSTAAVTATSYDGYFENLATNATTDAINKYGIYVTSTGIFTGGVGVATNNYGIYLATASGGDNNYQIYDQSGAYLSTAGTWTNAPSYRRYKDNYVGTESYLDRLMTLDVYEWQYKNETMDGMNRYANDPNRHASPFLDDFYNVFHLGTDKGVNVQDMAGVALASIKELNTRFQLQSPTLTGLRSDIDRVVGMDAEQQTLLETVTLKTDQSATTIAELQNSIDTQLGVVSTHIQLQGSTLSGLRSNLDQAELTLSGLRSDLDGQENRLKQMEDLTVVLQQQIVELQARTNQDLNLAQLDANTTDLSFLKTLLGMERVNNAGDVDILGKFSAEVTETGALVIKIKDEEARTIGEAVIYPMAIDSDTDGNDDFTGQLMTDPEVVARDGKSVAVKTKAVNGGSKVFVTPKTMMAQALAVTETNLGESFKAEVLTAVTEPVKFDWMIVEEK